MRFTHRVAFSARPARAARLPPLPAWPQRRQGRLSSHHPCCGMVGRPCHPVRPRRSPRTLLPRNYAGRAATVEGKRGPSSQGPARSASKGDVRDRIARRRNPWRKSRVRGRI